MSTQTEAAIDWSRISQRLDQDHASSTRLNRALKAPLRSGMVVGMRRFGWNRPVAAPLPWGDVFHGRLPEAVTSVIWRTGHYEPVTTRFVIETLKPGDMFVDIGAHFGYFTLLASRLVGPTGKVLSIEAMPSTFEMLSQNVSRNGRSNVELHNCAAYSKPATLQFKDFGVVHSSLNTAFSVRGVLEGHDAAFKEIDVEAVPADQLLEPHRGKRIAMIKIDAESSEEFVLQGLSKTLTVNRPVLLLELGGSASDDASRLKVIINILVSAGYHGRRWHDGELEAVPVGGDLPYDNYIWIHASMLDDPRWHASRTVSSGASHPALSGDKSP
jgi:FkbM family methyltransferase